MRIEPGKEAQNLLLKRSLPLAAANVEDAEEVILANECEHRIVGHLLRTQDLIEEGGPLEVGQGDDLGGLHELPGRNVIHDRGPGVVEVALRVGPVRPLVHSGVEPERDQALLVMQANHEAAESPGHVGNRDARRGPQLLLGRRIIDDVQEFIGGALSREARTMLMLKAMEGGGTSVGAAALHIPLCVEPLGCNRAIDAIKRASSVCRLVPVLANTLRRCVLTVLVDTPSCRAVSGIVSPEEVASATLASAGVRP